MNASARWLLGMTSMLIAGMTTTLGLARDWTDLVTAPLLDPLQARPHALDAGKILPGDRQAHHCSGVTHDLSKPLSLSEAVNLALCHNPQVQTAWIGIKIQAAQVGEARAAYLPVVTVGGSRLKQKSEQKEDLFTVVSNRRSDSQYATLTWRLLDFGGRDANRRSANALLEAALASHDATLQTTIGQMVRLYFETQTAQAELDAKGTGELLAQQTLKAAQKREQRGVGSQSDTLLAETALAKAELEHVRAFGAYEKSMIGLLVTLGLPWNPPYTSELLLSRDELLDDQAMQHDLTDWLNLAQKQHPALIAARAQLESARERAQSVLSEGLPTVDYSYSRYINGRPNQGVSSTQSQESVVGVTLNFPLFEGFGRIYKVQGARAQIEIKESERHALLNQIQGDVAKAHAEAVSALRGVPVSERLVEAALESMEQARRRFERGVADILEMLKLQEALADAEKERVQALAEWRASRLRLLALAGAIGFNHLTSSPNLSQNHGANQP